MNISTIKTKIIGFITRFKDLRVVGLSVFVVVILMVTWSSINTIQTNYELQKEIAKLEQENALTALENENERLSNEYFASDQYVELEARRVFGKAEPGEKLVIIPREVAMSKVAESPRQAESEQEVQESEVELAWYRENLRAWADFFLNRTIN
jgi:cell division protein FtsB